MSDEAELPPPPADAQVTLAIGNALVQLTDMLVAKGLLSAAEVAALLDAEAAKFAAMRRPSAAAFTTLMADSFRSTDDGQGD